MSCAKLFGCAINVEAEEGGGGGDGGGGGGGGGGGDGDSSIAVEVSRSGIQPVGDAMSLSVCVPPFNQREIGGDCNPCLEWNSDSGSATMDAEPELIDFFYRDTVGEVYVSPNQRVSISGDLNMEDGVELGLGIGLGPGSGQLGGDSGRVVYSDRVIVGTGGTPVDEAMVIDEELEWDDSQNAISLVQEPVQNNNIVNLEEEDEDEEDDIGEQYPEWQFFWEVAESLEESADITADSEFMDYDIGVFLDIIDVDGENHGDYNAIIGQMFENEARIMGSPPASKKVVDDLPLVEITVEELSNNGNIVCAICKDDVVVEDKVKRLPCKHYYHGDCIVPWLGMRNTCPVCRYELPTDDLEYERNKRSQNAR